MNHDKDKFYAKCWIKAKKLRREMEKEANVLIEMKEYLADKQLCFCEGIKNFFKTVEREVEKKLKEGGNIGENNHFSIK